MDQFVYRKNLLEPALLRELTKRSNQPGIIRLSIHLTIIGVCGWLVWLADSTWWLLPAWFVYGTALVFLFAPLHECIHRTAFRNRRLNDWVATIAGFLLLLPANYFRAFHFAHHRHTNDVELDPERLTPKPQSLPQYLWAMVGIGTYWWPQIRSIVRHARGNVPEQFIADSDRKKIVVEARTHVVAYGAILGGSVFLGTSLIVIYWIIPMLLSMVVLRMFLLAEHAGCEDSDNMLKNTRTTLTHPFVKLIAWNMPYHCEHHVFPAVPFHQLPALHQHLKDQLGVVANGYHRFHLEYLDSI